MTAWRRSTTFVAVAVASVLAVLAALALAALAASGTGSKRASSHPRLVGSQLLHRSPGGVGGARKEATTIVSLTFNDGLASQYRNAGPSLASHGMHGTFYVATDWAHSNDPNYMRFYQLDALYRQGNEIGGLGKDHKNLLDTYKPKAAADLAFKKDQVCGAFHALSDRGYDPRSFAYPEGADNRQAQQIVRDCGFQTGRVSGGLSTTGPRYAEPNPPAQPYQLHATQTRPGAITLQELEDQVATAAANGGGWVPIAFNEVCSKADAVYSTCMSTGRAIDAGVFSSFLDWLRDGAPAGTVVRTVRDVMGAPQQPPLSPLRHETIVSLTFDDGTASQYRASQILDDHRMHGTYYINSGNVDRRQGGGTMTWSQIQQMAGRGHDIGGHTQYHVNLTGRGGQQGADPGAAPAAVHSNTTYRYKWHQVCDDRERLFEKGINAVSFAYPFAALDSKAARIVQGCGYQSGRTGGSLSPTGPVYAETTPPKDPYEIRTLGDEHSGPITLSSLQYAVNQTVAHGGGWLPMVFHLVCFPGDADYDTCMASYRPIEASTLDAFVTWLQQQVDRGVRVRDVAEVMGGGATAPVVRVTMPTGGAAVTDSRPALSGTAVGNGSVKVRVYRGSYSIGTPVRILSAPVNNGTWSVHPDTALADGTYTFTASQTTDSATGRSTPVTFKVTS